MQAHQTFDPTDPALIAFMEDYLRTALQEQLREQMDAFVRANEHRAQEFSLLERIVRVEEELRALREMDAIRFDAMEKRFADQKIYLDKRFEAMQATMNQRFEQMDKRFETMQATMNQRFEQVDKRFEQVDQRFEALTRRLDRFMIWSLGLTISATALIITVLK